MDRSSEARTLGKAALLVGSGLALATVALALAARTAKRSLRAQVLVALLAASRRRVKFADNAGLMAAVKANREAGAATPPASFKRTYKITTEQRDGILVYRAVPRDSPAVGTILYVHGGAYVFDLVAAHWSILQGLARRTGAELIVPIYPLAPENDHQRAVDVLDALWGDLVAQGKAPSTVIAGDSAGAGLALAFTQRLRDAAKALPAGLLLFSPWLDVTVSDPEQATIERHDQMLMRAGLREAGRLWAGVLPKRDPMVSPLFGTMDGLPPIAVFTGTIDLLMPDARKLRDAATSVGVAIRYHEYAGMFHVWVGAPIPEAKTALDEAAAFVRENMTGA